MKDDKDAPPEDSGSEEAATSPVTRFIAYRISRVYNKLNAQTARILQDLCALTLVQWRIIALMGTLGRATQSELVAMSAFDKGLVSRNLKALLDKGYLTSKRDERDRRLLHLELTPLGQDIFETTLPALIKRNDDLIAAVDPADLEAFWRVLVTLDKILAA